MRQMASDPIKTAHEPRANESHRISAAKKLLSPKQTRTLKNLIRTLGLKCGHHRTRHTNVP